MLGSITIINPDGSTEVNAGLKAVPALSTFQKWVGGSIQIVPQFNLYDGCRCVVFCDEEGKLNDRPVNNKATALWLGHDPRKWSDVLVGTVVIVTGDRAFMEAL